MGRFPLAAAALALTGCMNLVLTQAIQDPGPHDSPITVIALGGIGDAGLAAIAAGVHASSDEELSFEELIPFYALPLFAVDLLVTIIRIQNYRK